MTSYFEHPAASQSRLKLLAVNPRLFNTVEEPELYFEEKKHFLIGDGVDYSLTQADKDFGAVFHISNLQNKPSDTMKSIINQLFDAVLTEFDVTEIGRISDPIYMALILQCCEQHTYQTRWNDSTKISKVCENYEYWEDLKSAHGKKVLSQEESLLIDSIVMSMRTDEACAKYFNSSNVSYQVPIYFKYGGIECKALLDMVIIDESKKEIQPIDIKTMGDYTLNFPQALKKRRYDIQAAFYTEALKYLYPDYTILPFKFIVESTIDVGSPLVYTLNKELLEMGKNGRPEIFLVDDVGIEYQRLQSIKGFVQLIELYKYYITNGFEVDQRVRESNSELTIDWSGIL